MSQPVISALVGYAHLSSSVCCGQPSVVKGQSLRFYQQSRGNVADKTYPEENHVSNTSGSCSSLNDLPGNFASAFFRASASSRPAIQSSSSLPNGDGLSSNRTYYNHIKSVSICSKGCVISDSRSWVHDDLQILLALKQNKEEHQFSLPHHSCLERHQSSISCIQRKYFLSSDAGKMVMSPFLTALIASSASSRILIHH